MLAPAQEDLERSLASGLGRMGIAVEDNQLGSLAQYLITLAQWNETYNLTAVRNPDDMVIKHVLDSATALPYLHGVRVLDVGTGAGLPGIPLAVFDPQRQYTLLDSNGKKTRFITHVLGELKLDHVDVVQARVEDYAPEQRFDTVITRAFATLEECFERCAHLLAPGGRLVAMKGRYPDDELKPLLRAAGSIEVEPVEVPELDAERHVVIIEPEAES